MKNIKIYANSSEVMEEVKDDYVDIIITSPPYNFKSITYIGTHYNYRDNLKEDEYFSMLKRVFRECYRVMKDDGVFFLNVGFNRDNLRRAWQVLHVAEEAGFKYYQPIVWLKSFDGQGHHSPSNNKKHFYLNYEYIFILTKTDNFLIESKKVGIPFKDKTNIKRRGHKEDLRDAGNVWFIPYDTKSGKKENRVVFKSLFPFELARRCLMVKINKEVLLDPFCGTATTLLVGNKLGLECIGYDVSFNEEEFEKRKKQYEEVHRKSMRTKI